ncbi:MAG: inositol monophosphatase, partial [Calditrichaeota bacterium]|nr:inositol monophosphatase [Calditrichota bacterium]
MNKYDTFAKTAVELADIGGNVLLKYFKNINEKTVESKGIGDWVSEADRASEDAIVDHISREMPTHDILTEERAQIVRSEHSEF